MSRIGIQQPAGAQLFGFCLPRRRPGMVDLMSPDPSEFRAFAPPFPTRRRAVRLDVRGVDL
jgi:hypothetical protein